MRKYNKKSIQYLSKDELKNFFKAILAQKNPKKAKRDFLIFKMIYFHALRCSEVVKIKLHDLDLEKNKIYIEATKKGKFGNEFLNPFEKDLILEYLEIRPKDETDFLFISDANRENKKGGQIGRQQINTLFVEFSQKAGIGEDKQHPHVLRHTLAVNCANSGFKLEEVQAFLRHKSSKTTEIYFQILEERKLELQKLAFLSL